MKRIFTLFLLALALPFLSRAAAPTVPSSNMIFKAPDGGRFTVDFTPGNGSARIVVMKEGSPVTGLPVNGKTYTSNTRFGTAGTEFSSPGEYVVQITSWDEFSPTNLKPGTTYHLAVFEYNGSGASIEYLMLPLTGSTATMVAPTVPVSTITSPAKTGNTLTLNWAAGNGTGRIVVARKGAAVDAAPVDVTDYSYSDGNFGSGTKLGTDNYVVYKGTATSAVVRSLEPNTEYHFAIFEYNGNYSPVYLTPGIAAAFTTHAGPTRPASSLGYSYVEGNRFNVGCTVGDGTRRIFIMKKGSPVTAVPVNGATYTANAAFGTAGTEIAPGEFVVLSGAGNSVGVTNLEPETEYHVRVYEMDVDKAGNTYYLTSSYTEKSGSTCIAPATIATNVKTTTITGSSATFTWTNGSGGFRLVLMKEGGPVDAAPDDLRTYGGSHDFGSGTLVGNGNYVITGYMNGAQITVNNLKPGRTYHIAVFEYNGSYYPVYSKTAAVGSCTIPLEPTAAATRPWTALVDGNKFRLVWNNGNGGRRILVASKGSPVTAKPVDGTTYAANGAFGSGHELEPGQYVVYDGDYYSADLTNLEIGATYHFALYEYNVGPDGAPDYLTTAWMAATGSTITWPTTQTKLTSASNLQATQATINFTAGNGENRLFIMREASAVNAVPQDGTRYSYATSFGTASAHIADGNYAVATGTGSYGFNVTNLKPLTTYYVTAHEFNGTAHPAYLTTAPTMISFTTPDVPGATVPTAAASSAVFTGVDGNKFTLKWNNGNGEKRIVVMRQGSAVDFVPASATAYTANGTFGAGTDLGGGQYVVYNGTANTIELSGLLPAITYHFAVYEYNGTGTTLRYLTSSLLKAAGSTAQAPTATPYEVTAATTASSLTLSWLPGNGAGRLVVLKEESAVAALPATLSVYPASSVFKSGSQLAAGEYVVYSGTGNSVTITGLSGKTYHYRIFEFNGSSAPVYNTVENTSGSVVVSTPLPVKLLYFTAKETKGSVVLTWATAQEADNEAFLVERSVDGQRYETVQRIAGAGNSTTTLVYTHTDNQLPPAARVYYRLKQVDIDGRFTYSGVVSVALKGEQSGLSVYPNPVGAQFRITLPAGATQGVLSIFDAAGVLRTVQKISGTTTINSSPWAAGTYYVQLQAGGKVFQQTIVK